MNTFIFGIDIGGQSVKSGLFSLQGQILRKDIIPTNTANNGACVLWDTANLLLRQARASHLSMKDCYGIGICVPGPVVKDAIVNHCVNIGWGLKNVAKELEAHLLKLLSSQASAEISIPEIIVSNDANAALLGEATAGAGKSLSLKLPHDTLVMLTLGTGVGGSILSENNLITGTTGSAGEVGHMPITVVDPLLYPKGKTNSLESFIGTKAIVDHTKRILSMVEYSSSALKKYVFPTEPPCRQKNLTPKLIFDLAHNLDTKIPGNGDSAAGYIANFTGRILGQALASIAAVLDPNIFIIGGGIAGAGDILLHPAKETYKTYAFHSIKDVPILSARLGNDAGIIGCYHSLFL